MIITPATRLQDHPEASTLLKLLRHFGYSSAQIMQALAHLDGDRPAENKAFFALLDSQHIDYAVSGNGAVVVHGYLYLSNTDITTLPDNLSIGGGLDLRGTGITVIPDSVHVGGNILMSAFRAGTEGGVA